MTFLPIVERELRVAARRKSTYFFRSTTALIAVLVGGMALLMLLLPGSAPNRTGGMIFATLSYYLFGICLLGGLFLAADCLSEERREGTLGLLFLTDLKGYDVVLGKMLAVALNAFYALLAVFPILGLSLVIGGVEGVEFGRVCLALFNALWFSTTLALWASSRSESGGRSLLRASLGLILLVGLLPGFTSLFYGVGWIFHVGSISPFTPFYYAHAENFWHRGEKFWSSLVISNLAGCVFLALASWRLEGSAQIGPPQKSPGGWDRFLVGDLLLGSRQRVAGLLEVNPVAWFLEDSRRLKWLIRLLCILGVIVMLICVKLGPLAEMALRSCSQPFYFLLKLLFAVQACRFFGEARRNGTIELLCITPLSGKKMIEGQWQALRRLFLWPVVALMSAEFVLVALSWLKSAPGSTSFSLVFNLFFGVPWQLLTNVADFAALGWLGMWLALTARKPQSAGGLTILFVLVLPALAFCVPSLVIDVVLIAVYMAKLGRDFRLILAEADSKRR